MHALHSLEGLINRSNRLKFNLIEALRLNVIKLVRVPKSNQLILIIFYAEIKVLFITQIIINTLLQLKTCIISIII